MTENADAVIKSDARLERVLDVAADLLLRWGYQRVTIEEIARRAGIGKGTVYLHFPTKDALFLTLLLRAQRRSITLVVDRMEADPADALPSRSLRLVYGSVQADPVLRALYLGDAAVLGRLVHEAKETLGELARARRDTVRQYLVRLRAAGAVRTDLAVDDQLHLIGAVSTGFFFADAADAAAADAAADPAADTTAAADRDGLPDDRRGALLAHTLAAALEVPDPPIDALAAAVPDLVAPYRALIELFDEEWRRRVR